MRKLYRSCVLALAILLFARIGAAATYYVSTTGDDAADGTSIERPWKTCQKVNTAKFAPGDSILFHRGDEWHDHLQASSDGAAGSPITYDAYGDGAKPKIWGSDVLDNLKFTPANDSQYSCNIGDQADSALCDHVFIPSSCSNGVLTITPASDPRTDKKVYTACLRGNVIFSNRKSHLVFRNLIVDETAGQLSDGGNQGYGVRIEGSTDVLVESCEAYRCARHHFAAINSTGFIGRHLIAGYVQPKTPGDNTAYVSYADAGAPVAKCTSEWDDIAAINMDDGKGGRSLTFVSHGDNQGLITMENSTLDNKVSFMSGPMVCRNLTLKENASIENWGKGALIDAVTLLDTSAIDQWASDGIIQNCVAHLTGDGGGPTGYRTAIVCRDKANGNVIRFNTLVTGGFSCLEMAGDKSATRWYGNIMLADGTTVNKGSGVLTAEDITSADYNFYNDTATFAGKSFKDWQASGFDQHSMTGDPLFVDASTSNCQIKPNSPCAQKAAVDAADVPSTDVAGTKRGSPPSIGAFEPAP